MKHFFATLLLATPLSSFADTIEVKQAEIVGPVTFSSPYIISEKNQKGQTFNQQEFFNNNISLLQEKSKNIHWKLFKKILYSKKTKAFYKRIDFIFFLCRCSNSV